MKRVGTVGAERSSAGRSSRAGRGARPDRCTRLRPGALVFGFALLLVAVPVAGQGMEEGPPPPPPDEIPALLESEESRAEALAGIRARAETLSGARATLWTQLLAVASRAGPEAGPLAARAVLRADAGDPAGGVELVEAGLDDLDDGERVTLLALAAHLAEADSPERAARLRERLLTLDPEAPEAPEATLRLARYLAGPGEEPERAVELLEDLVVRDPDHSSAPEARRLIRQIRDGAR